MYLVMSTLIRFIPSSILKSPAHIVKFLVIQKNVKYGTKSIVLLKIVAITLVDKQVVYPKVFWPKKKSPSLLPLGKQFPLILLYDVHTTIPSITTGLIALGLKPLSFPSQIGSKRFSYCLLPYGTEYTDPSITGKISFGNGSEVVGDGVVSTPFVVVRDQYYVTLEGISVGDTYVPFKSTGKVSKGNVCSDLGSPPLTLPPDFYNRLEVEVKKQISIDPIKNETLTVTRLCYRTEITNENGPKLTVHFEGENVELKLILTYNRPVHAYDIYCFAITNTANTTLADLGYQGLYGNYVQANLLIVFYLETRMVSFKPTDCTKL